ncbi:JmjC domain-containing protein 4 [Auxenochlorella protothecoides]|uniref:JmjC domain-containing protein 4 n=2 Tax=Auxenochlorella protothecoides TaxID=3075 RepID=A0A087SRQ2_AUXPR|nr:JmjC domain-containing protein 4 [Auxenochlorella protothecoides]KFM28406.1 JmjC domain-containing protein 4 [Auxenochlorella protothecoides]
MLEVEFSDEGAARKYGQGMKQTMPFRRFLQSIADGEDSRYLTTQDVPTEIDGHPALYGSPLVALEGDFPRLPELAGSLVPASINLWMGLSAQGTSSGLHHDFHDNLYSLLRGRKTFRLWPPSALDSMYPHGRPVKRWPNGRVVYSEQGNIGPDGVDMDEERRWEEKFAAEMELEMAEKAVEAGEQGAKRRLQAANRRLDAVMDAAMDEGSEWLDDFDAMERPAQRPATSGAAPIPPSFSRIDADLPPAEIKKKFPRFKGFSSAITCTVEAGQTLYLPAGWWHEVTSQGFGGSKDAPGEHMALNHWFHPPDNLDAEAGFSKPYTRLGCRTGLLITTMITATIITVENVFHTAHPSVTCEFKGIDGLQREYGHDRAYPVLSLRGDWTSEFTWNTKQIFVYANVEFETRQNKRNEMLMWSKLLTSKDEATVDLPRLAQQFPYAVTDQGYTLRGTPFNISITWNVMPRVGRLYTRTQAFGPWELPQDYQTLQKEG